MFDLTYFGLLYMFEVKKKFYYVFMFFVSGLFGGFIGDDGDIKVVVVVVEGYIIVETNYRVYAYTFSVVEMEILWLFMCVDYCLFNLYVGMLMCESV